jgi:hypothetical protein
LSLSNRKYGFEFFIDENVKDGDEVHASLILGDTVTPRLTAMYWTLDTVTSAMEEAGFSGLRWVNQEVSEPGRAQHGEAFWDDFLRKRPHIFLDCAKA